MKVSNFGYLKITKLHTHTCVYTNDILKDSKYVTDFLMDYFYSINKKKILLLPSTVARIK